jgi:hypothetical protein
VHGPSYRIGPRRARPVFCFEIMMASQFLDKQGQPLIVRAIRGSDAIAWLPGSGAARGDLGRIIMKPTRKLSRRSFLGRVAGGAIVGGAALTVLTGPAEAMQASDSDSGPNADPSGRGRGNPNCSDSDSGQYGDPGGRGRRCGRTNTGCSDSDSGQNGDPSGRGRRCGGGRGTSGLTDRDTGRYADPAGNGRGTRRSGLTDRDTGSHSDPAGNGRGRRGRCTGVTDGDSGANSDPARCGRGPRRR